MASEEYKKAISNTVRETKAEISFDFSDSTAIEDASQTISGEAIFSNGEQVLNGNTEKTIKVATLEKGFWKLDGTYMNLGYKDISDEEIGYVSDVISDDNGEFNTPPIIIYNFFNTHSSIGLTLFFDALTNNYVSKMRIKFYNGEELLSDETVENTEITFVYSNKIENYNKVEIEFLKTSLPHRRVRYIDIIFGVIQTYKDKDIINCNLTREFNPFNDNIPSHEATIEIDNLSKKFNLINPTGVYDYLQKRQQVSIKFGVVLESGNIKYVNMGKYYLNDWNTKDLTATLKAKDLLSILEEIYYENLTSQTKTLKGFAEEILIFANIESYILDDSLDSISVTTTIEKTSVKELLKQIAIANNCVLYVDRENNICITKLVTEVSNTISLSNMYKFPEISLDEVVSSVKVIYSNNNELYISTGAENGKEKTVTSLFISTQEQAEIVGQYLVNLYQNRLKYKTDWRQDFTIDINNKTIIEDNFNENKNIVVTKQEFKYAGYLSGYTEGRGVG